MDTIPLTLDERELISYAKKAVIKYNTIRHEKGGIDTLYAFLMSNSGKMYDGACLESNTGHASICGERHAIANMVLNEGYASKIKTLVVAYPVPKAQEHGTTPCGTCRHLIWEFGVPDTTIILMQYIFHDLNGKCRWTFPEKKNKFTTKELYPHPYEPVEGLWD